MNRKRMEYFITAAETLNLTETAELHFITQASISGAIAALEDEIGFKLFDRSRRKLSLTPAGEYFYDACKNIIEIEDSYIRQARHISAYEDYRLTMGTSDGFCFSPVVRQLHRFKQLHPLTEFQFQTMDNDTLLEQVKSCRLDLALSFHFSGLPTDPACDELLLDTSRYGVLIPKGHPLEHEHALSAAMLKDQDILYPTNYTSGSPSTLLTLHQNGIFPTRVLKGWSVDQIILSVATDRCLVLIAEFFVEAVSYLDYVFIPFEQEMLEIELTLIKAKKNTRPAAKQVCEFFSAIKTGSHSEKIIFI